MKTGNAIEVIPYVAQTQGYDVIVLGTRSRNMDKATQLGSVSHGVLCRAHCPVVAVR